jgi:hypothetical protein
LPLSFPIEPHSFHDGLHGGKGFTPDIDKKKIVSVEWNTHGSDFRRHF